ncbi:MAG TPA: hypothetical protein VMR33_00965 [Candidatus Baltobacteraceae bacterium]|nr:hypothetical protein [Candidatus Baltobacteraceae bacterium]
MKRESDEDALLKDVFGEAAPASFREAMLGESLRVVRRCYRTRRVGRAAALLVLLGLVVVLSRHSTSRRPDVLSKAATVKVEKSYTLVRSQPLPVAATVTTRPLLSGQFIGATVFAGIVRTRPDGFRAINDDELLALLSPRPCALIQVGPNVEKLVFVNPDDAKGFPVN